MYVVVFCTGSYRQLLMLRVKPGACFVKAPISSAFVFSPQRPPGARICVGYAPSQEISRVGEPMHGRFPVQ